MANAYVILQHSLRACESRTVTVAHKLKAGLVAIAKRYISIFPLMIKAIACVQNTSEQLDMIKRFSIAVMVVMENITQCIENNFYGEGDTVNLVNNLLGTNLATHDDFKKVLQMLGQFYTKMDKFLKDEAVKAMGGDSYATKVAEYTLKGDPIDHVQCNMALIDIVLDKCRKKAAEETALLAKNLQELKLANKSEQAMLLAVTAFRSPWTGHSMVRDNTSVANWMLILNNMAGAVTKTTLADRVKALRAVGNDLATAMIEDIERIPNYDVVYKKLKSFFVQFSNSNNMKDWLQVGEAMGFKIDTDCEKKKLINGDQQFINSIRQQLDNFLTNSSTWDQAMLQEFRDCRDMANAEQILRSFMNTTQINMQTIITDKMMLVNNNTKLKSNNVNLQYETEQQKETLARLNQQLEKQTTLVEELKRKMLELNTELTQERAATASLTRHRTMLSASNEEYVTEHDITARRITELDTTIQKGKRVMDNLADELRVALAQLNEIKAYFQNRLPGDQAYETVPDCLIDFETDLCAILRRYKQNMDTLTTIQEWSVMPQKHECSQTLPSQIAAAQREFGENARAIAAAHQRIFQLNQGRDVEREVGRVIIGVLIDQNMVRPGESADTYVDALVAKLRMLDEQQRQQSPTQLSLLPDKAPHLSSRYASSLSSTMSNELTLSQHAQLLTEPYTVDNHVASIEWDYDFDTLVGMGEQLYSTPVRNAPAPLSPNGVSESFFEHSNTQQQQQQNRSASQHMVSPPSVALVPQTASQDMTVLGQSAQPLSPLSVTVEPSRISSLDMSENPPPQPIVHEYDMLSESDSTPPVHRTGRTLSDPDPNRSDPGSRHRSRGRRGSLMGSNFRTGGAGHYDDDLPQFYVDNLGNRPVISNVVSWVDFEKTLEPNVYHQYQRVKCSECPCVFFFLMALTKRTTYIVTYTTGYITVYPCGDNFYAKKFLVVDWGNSTVYETTYDIRRGLVKMRLRAQVLDRKLYEHNVSTMTLLNTKKTIYGTLTSLGLRLPKSWLSLCAMFTGVRNTTYVLHSDNGKKEVVYTCYLEKENRNITVTMYDKETLGLFLQPNMVVSEGSLSTSSNDTFMSAKGLDLMYDRNHKWNVLQKSLAIVMENMPENPYVSAPGIVADGTGDVATESA